MSQQPYEPYESYDPYQQQPQQQYEEVRGHTQTFQGQTWDTGTAHQHPQYEQYEHPPYAQYEQYQHQPQQAPEYQQQPQAPATDTHTAYLPPQGQQGQPAPTGAAPVAPATAPAAPAADADEPRLTYAQRARLEGRSPIIEPGLKPAGLTALLALLLAGGAALGSYGLLVPLLLLQALTAAGWFRLNGMWPARQGIALAFLGGVVADALVLIAGREYAPGAILGTCGVWVLLTLVLQLRSHAGADERMYGLMATVSSAALTILAGGTLAAAPEAVSAGAVAVAVAVVARALPLPGAASVVVAVLAAAGAGIAVGGMTDIGAAGALLGAGAGVCALVGLRVASYDYPSRFVHMTAGVALPLTAAVPALYLLGRVVA
ncbi:hypothetical protein [Streptomyces luteolus]|uniref:Integral membrane protein n=1 Tax=Streptomyces luteolus TaxID=3043615 RepID=A0ABT6SQJ4_9ACTN|nr:hypothetical protein [Streptomyces sp. B-S-A12]MDI3417866.1 hypothetical protein [Streptomyces sp. B-S-A12]